MSMYRNNSRRSLGKRATISRLEDEVALDAAVAKMYERFLASATLGDDLESNLAEARKHLLALVAETLDSEDEVSREVVGDGDE